MTERQQRLVSRLSREAGLVSLEHRIATLQKKLGEATESLQHESVDDLYESGDNHGRCVADPKDQARILQELKVESALPPKQTPGTDGDDAKYYCVRRASLFFDVRNVSLAFERENRAIPEWFAIK
jgi:hypothetical protein